MPTKYDREQADMPLYASSYALFPQPASSHTCSLRRHLFKFIMPIHPSSAVISSHYFECELSMHHLKSQLFLQDWVKRQFPQLHPPLPVLRGNRASASHPDRFVFYLYSLAHTTPFRFFWSVLHWFPTIHDQDSPAHSHFLRSAHISSPC